MRKWVALLVALTISAGFFSVQAQDAPLSGIDVLCGPEALQFTTADVTVDAATAEALDTVLRSMVATPDGHESESWESQKAPGAVLLVETPSGRFFRAVGVADVAACTPLDPTQPFAIGSNTKMFTAAVLYQLQEEGLLSVSDPVSKYLPEQIALFPRAADATIEQVLGHTAGLPDYLNSTNPESLGMRLQDPASGALSEAYTPEALIARAAALQDDADQPTFAPGEAAQWAYSNTGYLMLGLIIEQLTGQSYAEAVESRILAPLGLDQTVVVDGFAPSDLGLPTSYLQSPFTYNTSGWNYSQAWSAGDIVSTAEDMAKFVRAYFSGALFQNPETLETLLTPAALGAPMQIDDFHYLHGAFYKFGFLGHGGQTFGFESDPGFNPQTDTVIVVWTNAAESPAGMGVPAVAEALDASSGS